MSNGSQLCRECGTMVASDHSDCPKCGAALTAHSNGGAVTGGDRSRWKTGCLVILGCFVAFTILGALMGEPEQKGEAGSLDIPEVVGAQNNSSIDETLEESSNVIDSAPEQQANVGLTGPQMNALRSARQYLDMSGFSRAGLIDQLSSSAGEGYEVADATIAVDSLNEDWNGHAVRSARQYLGMMGFSCSGLVEQLSSSAGEKYTTSEAQFGAEQAGAC